MGTFSEKILVNDNSLDVNEEYFELYNQGKEFDEINKYIIEKYINISYNIIEDIEYHSAFCKAKWETQSLEKKDIEKLEKLVSNPQLEKLMVEYGASEKFISKRKKALEKFIINIKTPRSKAKLRKKPPKPLETIFKNGACFSFQFEDGNYGGAVVIESETFTTKGVIGISLTNINKQEIPTKIDFLESTLYLCDWSDASEGKKHKIAGIDHISIYYDTKKDSVQYLKGLNNFFEYIATIPAFDSGYHATSGLSLKKETPFEEVLLEKITYMHSDECKKIHLDIYKEPLKADTVKLKDFYALTKRE